MHRFSVVWDLTLSLSWLTEFELNSRLCIVLFILMNLLDIGLTIFLIEFKLFYLDGLDKNSQKIWFKSSQICPIGLTDMYT